MRRLILALAVAISVNAFAAAPHPTPSATVQLSAQTSVQTNYGKLPLSFEANQGQADPRVKFLSRGQGYSLFLTDSTAILSLNPSTQSPHACRPERSEGPAFSSRSVSESCPAESNPTLIRMALTNANPNAAATGESELPGKINYFLGNDPAKWHSDLPTYARVRYTQVYPGIDLVYYGNQQQLEYDFIVAPGASPTPIRLNFEGQKNLQLSANGDLILESETGSATLHKPILYQQEGTRREPIEGSFQLQANNTVTFKIGSYDHTRALIIDPILVYSTYLGGSGSGTNGDQGNGIAVDSAGSAYVVGTSYSADFPATTGAFQRQNNSATSTVFVTKLNPTGTALVYSTYLGGSGGDFGYGIALDAADNAYVTGTTYSQDFPVSCDAFQTLNYAAPHAAPTAFVSKLDPTGTTLAYSTYLGGTGNTATPAKGDVAQAIAVDPTGNAYITGYTYSDDFPTTSAAFQQQNGGNGNSANAFITKLNPRGTALTYSTFLGGSGSGSNGDFGNAIAIDTSGDAFVAGSTASSNFPATSGAFQTTAHSGSTGFVTELNPTGTAEVFSSYLGGSATDSAQAIVVDGAGDVYIAGTTSSNDYPVTNGVIEGTGFINNVVLKDALTGFGPIGFVTKLSASGSAEVYSTFVEGPGTSITGLAVDGTGSAYVSGNTTTTGFGLFGGFVVTPDAFAAPGSTSPPFLVKLDPSATVFNYASMLGGSSDDAAKAIALDVAGNIYITGYTRSTNLPTSRGAFQRFNNAAANSASNAFVGKFALGAAANHTGQLTAPVPPFPTNLELDRVTFGGDCFFSGISIQATFTLQTDVFGPPPGGEVDFYALVVDGFTGGPFSWGGNTTFTTSSGDGTVTAGLDSYGWDAVYTGDSLYQATNLKGTVEGISCPDPDPFSRSMRTGRKVASIDRLPTQADNMTRLASTSAISAHSTQNKLRVEAEKFVPPVLSNEGSRPNHATLRSADQGTNTCSLPILTVTINPTSRLYGASNPIFTYTLTGLLHGDTVTVAVPTTEATPASAVGTYPVITQVRGAALASYRLVVNDAALTVLPAPLIVSGHPVSRPYGGVNPNPFVVTGLKNGDTVTVTASSTATSISPVGTYPLTATLSGPRAVNYTPVVTNTTLTITKAVLSVFATSYTSTYGQTPTQPAAFHFKGFVAGDTVGVVSGAPVLSTSVTSSTPVGSYPIQIAIGTLSAGNYTIVTSGGSGLPGVVQVLPARLYMNLLPSNATRVYGASNPSFTNTVPAGLVNGDTVTVAIKGPGSTAPVGAYPLTITLGGPSAANYTPIAANKAQINITPSALTVNLLPATKSRLYGAANPTFTATIAGLLNGDSVTATPTTTATSASPVGTYPVTATLSGPAAANYTPSIRAAVLVVSPVPLQLTATSYTSTYGQTPPAPTAFTLKGFLNGDTASVVSGAPALSTTVTSITPVGYYPIQTKVGTLTATNYTIVPFPKTGVVHVGKAPLTAKANNATMPKGGPIPTFTYTLTGFVNGDTPTTSVTGAPTLRTSAGPTSKPGNYPIYLSTGTLGSANYSITPANGVLTILP